MGTLIVVGFHRSGTSMATRILHGAGLFVGDSLLGAIPSNPYGHFEDTDILAFHDKMLEANGSSWTFDGDARSLHVSDADLRWMRNFAGRRNTLHRLWGFKDPRVCLFLAHWNRVVEDAFYFFVFRDFLETTQSILNRQSIDILKKNGDRRKHLEFWKNPGLALRMWVSSIRAMISFVEAHSEQVHCVRHRQLLDGYPMIELLNKRFGLDLDEAVQNDLVDRTVTTTDVESLPCLDDPALVEARDLWSKVERLTEGRDYDLDVRIASVAKQSDAQLWEPFSVVGRDDLDGWREYQRLFETLSSRKERDAASGTAASQSAGINLIMEARKPVGGTAAAGVNSTTLDDRKAAQGFGERSASPAKPNPTNDLSDGTAEQLTPVGKTDKKKRHSLQPVAQMASKQLENQSGSTFSPDNGVPSGPILGRAGARIHISDHRGEEYNEMLIRNLRAYAGAKQNPDGSWVCGGNYVGAHQNPDGTWVCGGAYTEAHQNPNGTWVVGGAHSGAHQNPDGTWVCGGAHTDAHQNPNGTWVVGGAHNGAHQNPDGTWVCA